MQASVRVLSDEERALVHERTLGILARTGVRVDTGRGRRILAAAGAEVDESSGVVRFPRALVEEALRLAPRAFALGGRRSGWSLPLGAGGCSLVADGEALFVVDAPGTDRRPGTHADWLAATHLIDALDEVGVYWRMVAAGLAGETPDAAVRHWHEAHAHFSKHVQDAATTPLEARWLTEVLGTIFGGREAVRRLHPFSFLLCPHSPLVLEGAFTDAYLETVGWDLPVAVMPMPLMGLSAPPSLASTIVLANAEVIAMLCLVQAAAPGTPFIYAAAPSVMDPRSGRFGGGAAEHALLGAAVTEMARHYGLPAESSAGGTDHHVPGVQAGYERASSWVLPALSWPDLLVGPGLLGGSMILSLEQLVVDVEVFRRCARMRRGIGPLAEDPVAAEIGAVGPAGTFLERTSTRDALRAGEWLVARLGVHDTYERWDEAGRRDLLDEARELVAATRARHEPLPLEEGIVAELEQIEARARAATSAGTDARAGAHGRARGASKEGT